MGARREAREALAAAGLRPQKRWGQHFLCDPGVARRIVAAADVGPRSIVLEIGPGLGALTDVLAGTAGRLYLVEIDRQLADRLTERYAANPRVRIVVGDVLELPLDVLLTEPSITVVANLPYNVAVPVLFRLLALRTRFPRAVVMLQREVAHRLAAPAGHADRGVTSVLIQTFAEVRVAFGVSKRSFLPPPQVESAVVDIRWSTGPRVPIGDEAAWRDVVRGAFGQRRKMLRNALAGVAARRGLDAAALDAAFAAAAVDPRARAETLDLEAFGRLAQALGT
jgi:16S rRNA (adenine1518-N6/adenine1519-N6)-dimethyltransferase